MVDIDLFVKLISAIIFFLIAIILSIFSIIFTRVLSNYVTQLTIYHKTEKYRTVKLYMTYLFFIFPSTVVLYLVLSGMSLKIESDPELFFISCQISFFIPFVCRVASLVKIPFPFSCKSCISKKSSGMDFVDKLFKSSKLCNKIDCGDKDKSKQVWNESRERIASFTYSLLCSILLFIFVFLLTHISRKLNIITNVNYIDNFYISFEFPTSTVILITSYFLFIPFIMAIIGEKVIKILGGVPDSLLDETDKPQIQNDQ